MNAFTCRQTDYRGAKLVTMNTRSYESFLEAKGTKKDAKKLALLLYCARKDVQHIFVTLSDPRSAPEEETVNAKALKLLDADFPRK